MATSNSQSSQSVTSAYIVRRAFTGLISDGAQLGGCYFYLGIFCALPIVTDSDM